MKSQDFERLKAICEKEGFELVTESPKENDKFYVVKKKDKWEGVEFVMLSNNRIFKVLSIDNTVVNLMPNGWATIRDCKPSTEQAYVEQLKKDAFERFGEIKEGDSFFSVCDGKKDICQEGQWIYLNEVDYLCYGGISIYKKGKWAERVKERIKVINFGMSNIGNKNAYSFLLDFASKVTKTEEEISDFLSQQLEKYLNDEI